MSVALAERPYVALTPLERLEALCDPGSLNLIRSEVISPPMGEKARPGDGVIGGAGRIDGRPVFCYAQDSGYAGGSLGEQHANTIVRVLELAERGRASVVGFVSSGGARMRRASRRWPVTAASSIGSSSCPGASPRSRSLPVCPRAGAPTRPR